MERLTRAHRIATARRSGAAKMMEKLRRSLRAGGEFHRSLTSLRPSVRLPFMPNVSLTGVNPDGILIFASATYPIVFEFYTETVSMDSFRGVISGLNEYIFYLDNSFFLFFF